MEPSEILEDLFDSKILKILKHFMKNPDKEFYLRELSRITRVSPASTYRILNRLVKLDILLVKEIKTAKLYSIKQNKTVEFMKSILEVDVIELFVEQASKVDQVEEVMLLGKKEQDKANLLLLGDSIDTAKVKLFAGVIKEEHGFTINHMSLSRDQFEQMSSMGLYPGSKKVLYKKV